MDLCHTTGSFPTLPATETSGNAQPPQFFNPFLSVSHRRLTMHISLVTGLIHFTLSLLFVQLMHTNYYKIVKQLTSFKIIIVAPTRFGLHKPLSFNLDSARSTRMAGMNKICSHNTDNFK